MVNKKKYEKGTPGGPAHIFKEVSRVALTDIIAILLILFHTNFWYKYVLKLN